MYAFSYWHAYYDSLFLKNAIMPSRFFLDQLQIISATHMSWTIISELPQLSRMFQALQTFIMDHGTWNSCFCDECELQIIEEKMNNIVILLFCQKIYGKEYWEQDKRRVQASFVHLVIIFKHYLLAILPDDEVTIQQASNQGRLPTNLVKLQNLVNVLLNLLKPIHRYLFTSFFQEENQLTIQFFNGLSYFLQNLPRLERWQISDVPRLMRFICLCNTLQANRGSIKQFHQNRRQSETSEIKRMILSPLTSTLRRSDRKSDVLVNREFIKEKSLSSKNRSISSKQGRNKQKRYTFFKFSKNLSRNEDILQKKQTEATFMTKDKSSTMDRKSRYRSTTIQPKYSGLIKSRTFEKKTSNANPATRKNTAISIETNHLIDNQYGIDQFELERINKNIKVKAGIIKVKYQQISKTLNLETGRPKGWAIIREHVFNRIAIKKFQRLLHVL